MTESEGGSFEISVVGDLSSTYARDNSSSCVTPTGVFFCHLDFVIKNWETTLIAGKTACD